MIDQEKLFLNAARTYWARTGGAADVWLLFQEHILVDVSTESRNAFLQAYAQSLWRLLAPSKGLKLPTEAREQLEENVHVLFLRWFETEHPKLWLDFQEALMQRLELPEED